MAENKNFIVRIEDYDLFRFACSILKLTDEHELKLIKSQNSNNHAVSIKYILITNKRTEHVMMFAIKDFDCYLMDFNSLEPKHFTKKFIKFMLKKFGLEYKIALDNYQQNIFNKGTNY